MHFPIAFLTIYACFELMPFKKLHAWQTWFYVRAVLLFVGWVGSWFAILSGKAIEEEFASTSAFAKIVETHEHAAFTTMFVFLILVLTYGLVWIQRDVQTEATWRKTHVWMKLSQVALFIYESYWLRGALAFVGLIAVTVTGALGGGMVHGPEVDPAVGFIYRLFGL